MKSINTQADIIRSSLSQPWLEYIQLNKIQFVQRSKTPRLVFVTFHSTVLKQEFKFWFISRGTVKAAVFWQKLLLLFTQRQFQLSVDLMSPICRICNQNHLQFLSLSVFTWVLLQWSCQQVKIQRVWDTDLTKVCASVYRTAAPDSCSKSYAHTL